MVVIVTAKKTPQPRLYSARKEVLDLFSSSPQKLLPRVPSCAALVLNSGYFRSVAKHRLEKETPSRGGLQGVRLAQALLEAHVKVRVGNGVRRAIHCES